jgi:hypothetical protein
MELCGPGPALICFLVGGGTRPHALPRIGRAVWRCRLRSFDRRIVLLLDLKSPLRSLFFLNLHRGLRDVFPSFFLPLLHALRMSGGRQQRDHHRRHRDLFHDRPPCSSGPRSRLIGGLVDLCPNWFWAGLRKSQHRLDVDRRGGSRQFGGCMDGTPLREHGPASPTRIATTRSAGKQEPATRMAIVIETPGQRDYTTYDRRESGEHGLGVRGLAPGSGRIHPKSHSATKPAMRRMISGSSSSGA